MAGVTNRSDCLASSRIVCDRGLMPSLQLALEKVRCSPVTGQCRGFFEVLRCLRRTACKKVKFHLGRLIKGIVLERARIGTLAQFGQTFFRSYAIARGDSRIYGYN